MSLVGVSDLGGGVLVLSLEISSGVSKLSFVGIDSPESEGGEVSGVKWLKAELEGLGDATKVDVVVTGSVISWEFTVCTTDAFMSLLCR